MNVPKRTISKAIDAHDNLKALFEDFLQTMDYINGGGDTVARYRDKYQVLTGKKIYILGDGIGE